MQTVMTMSGKETMRNQKKMKTFVGMRFKNTVLVLKIQSLIIKIVIFKRTRARLLSMKNHKKAMLSLTTWILKYGMLGVFCFQEIKADFLPTGSMIEEVFGVESWNFKVTNNKNGSS